MEDYRAKELIKRGDNLFGKRIQLTSVWQDIAENFYPERADFTVRRILGDTFADNLSTSIPVLARRDLGNAFSSMLRPADRPWFKITSTDEETEDNSAKRWLEKVSTAMRNAMYDRATNFIRATKEGDHDFAAFGQCVISVELNRDGNKLLYRTWHLRDVAWCEDSDGKIDTVHRKWSPTARDLVRLFGDKTSDKVRDALEKDPYKEVECRHVIMPAEQYNDAVKQYKTPYVSIHIDVENSHVMAEEGTHNFRYVIPRWETVSGSQYAYSPATIVALPDARLIQAMTLSLLEAGEKAANPPMVAVGEVLRSDINVYAGGITQVDADYDERLGEALRPIAQDASGLRFGADMQEQIRVAIMDAFYLNKINLPPMGGERVTAFEIGQRVQEYIRNALPLFEPMEMDYNGAVCEFTFDLLMRNGAFGSPQDIPQSLRGEQIKFRFSSPLKDAGDKAKGQTLLEAGSLLANMAAYNPNAPLILDTRVALREALHGVGVPAKWLLGEKELDTAEQQAKQQQQAQAMLAQAQQGSEVAKNLGQANASLGGP